MKWKCYLLGLVVPPKSDEIRKPHEKVLSIQDNIEDGECNGERIDVNFEAKVDDFSRLIGVGPNGQPSYEILIQGADIGAHEAAIYLANGAGNTTCPCLIFTTKPYARSDGSTWVDIKRLIVSGKEKGSLDIMHSSCNLCNGGCLGLDGRLYFCFQGKGIGRREAASDDYLSHHPSGIYSVNPRTFDDWLPVTPQSLRFNSPNDVVIRQSDGTIWFSDPSYAYAQGHAPRPILGDWVWRFCPKTGDIGVAADGFMKPNGLVFSPDQHTLFVTDTGSETGSSAPDFKLPRTIYAFDIFHNRLLANRRLVYVADHGIPDGIKADEAGRLYTGCADGVHIILADGLLLGKILLTGCHGGAANLCFGTKDHRGTLFILAERAVISVNLDTVGAPVGIESPSPPSSASDQSAADV